MRTGRDDRRLRGAARLSGGVVLGVVGLGMFALGVLVASGQEEDGAWGLAAFGWILLATGTASVVRAVGDSRDRRRPFEPRLSSVGGEPALHFPRHRTRGAVSAWVLVALALAPLMGAVAAFAAGSPVGGCLLLAVAVLMLWLGSPHQVDAGGLWLTPSRLVHRHDGNGWEVRWENVRGASDSEPFGIAVRERPTTTWAVSQLRRWSPTYKHDVLWIDGRDMAGDADLRYEVILEAVADPGFRAALGTPASLPPEDGTR